MKRSKLLILLVVLALSCLTVVAACEEHTHTYGDWTLTTNPTLDQPGEASRPYTCGCEGSEKVTVPALSDTSVWTATPNPAPTHTTDGATDYVSEYGTVTIVVPKLADAHVFNQQIVADKYLATAATCTAKATYYYSCVCGEKGSETFESGETLAHDFSVFVEVTTNPTLETDGIATFKCANCDATKTDVAIAKLSDTSVWTATVTNPTYSKGGYTTYTTTFFEHDLEYVANQTPALDAPYLGKDYKGFYFNSNAYISKKDIGLSIDSTGNAKDTFCKTEGVGWGTTYENQKVSFEIVDDSGKLKVIFSWTEVEEDDYGYGESSNKTEEHIGFVSADGNYIVIGEKDNGLSSLYVFYNTKAAATYDVKSFASKSAKLAVITVDGVAHTVFAHAGQVYFDVVLNNFNGEDISVADVDSLDYIAVVADGAKVAGFFKQEDDFLLTDGYEGIFQGVTIDGEIAHINGVGNIVIMLNDESGNLLYTMTGTYVIAPDGAGYTLDAYVVYSLNNADWYLQIKLDKANGLYEWDYPTATITYVVNGGDEIASEKVNINVAHNLVTPTYANHKFLGWFLDETFETPVPEEFVPTADTTVYAKWSVLMNVTFADLIDGDSATDTVGEGDVLLRSAPNYSATTTKNGKLFRGWIVGEGEDAVIIAADYVVSAEDISEEGLVISANWADIVTLTVVYGNGLDDKQVSYAKGDAIDLDAVVPAFNNGKVFQAWYADAEFSSLFTDETIVADVTIYAQWETAVVPFIGEFKGLYVSVKNSGYDPSTMSLNQTLTVTKDGKLSGGESGQIVSYDAATGRFLTKDERQVGSYDAANGVIVFLTKNSSSTSIRVFFVGATNISQYGDTKAKYWNGKSTEVVLRVKLEGASQPDMMILIINDTVYANLHATYVKNDGDSAVEVDKVSDIPALAARISFYDANDNLVTTLKKKGYNLFECDNLDATYTGTLGDVVVDGIGGLTVDGTDATYTVVDDAVIGYILDNVYTELTLNKADGTYTAVVPTVTLTLVAGENSIEKNVNKNSSVNLAAAYTAPNGYVLLGFYSDAAFADEITSIVASADVTVYVKLVKGITVEFDTDGKGENPKSLLVAPDTVIDLPVLDSVGEFAFVGWYDLLDDTETIITSLTVTEDVILVAKWQGAIVLTLVYGNGLDNVEVKVSATTVIDMAEYAPAQTTLNGKIFVGWYTDSTFATEFAATTISQNTTVYAKWNDAHAVMGQYLYSANPCKSSFSYENKKLSNSTTLVVDENGNATGWKSGKIDGFNAAIGTYDFVVSSEVRKGGFNAAANLLYVTYYAGRNPYDIEFFVAAIGDEIPVAIQYTTWGDYTTKFIRVEYSDGTNTTYRYVLIYKQAVYAIAADGWTATDDKGNAVEFDQVSISATTITIAGAQNDGTIVNFEFAKSGSNFVSMDGLQGSYTLEGGATLVLDGAGNAKLVGDKTVSGTYATIEGGLELYMNGNQEYYTVVLDKDAGTYTIEKPIVVITFVTDHGTLEQTTVEANIKVTYFVTTKLTDEAKEYVFCGWYVQGDENQTIIKSFKPTEDTTLVAKWKEAVVVTVVQNNGYKTEVFEGVVGVGDPFYSDLPGASAVVNGLYAVGWYTTGTFDEGTEWTSGSVVTGDLTIYCKWVPAHAMAGTYSGAEVWGTTNFSGSKTLKVDPTGKVTGTLSGVIKDYDAETGIFRLYDSETSTTYRFGFFDAANKALAIRFYSGTDDLGNDTYVFVEGTNSVSNDGSIRWKNNENRLLKVTCGGESLYLLTIDNEYYAKVIVSVVDSNGAAVTDITKFQTKGNILTFKTSDGAVIATFGYDGTNFVKSDGLNGTYAKDGSDSVVLDGYGNITVGANAAVAYTVLENGNVYYVLNNAQHIISLDAANGSYSDVLDGMQGTWNLPDGAGTIVLDGMGGAGDGKTYVVNGKMLSVYDGETSATYGIGESFTLLGKSVFAGLTFTGKYYDNWNGSNVGWNFVFDDSAQISGILKLNRSAWLKFTGTLDGNTLVLTFLTENGVSWDSGSTWKSNSDFDGKTITATISGSTMTVTATTVKANSYTFASNASATCEGFSL